MRAIIQTVKDASVLINNTEKRSIKQGMLVYICFKKEDTLDKIDKMIYKISGLRIFKDNQDKINLSLKDIDGEIMIISNFTIYGSLEKGFRPSFDNVLEHSQSILFYQEFVTKMKQIFNEKVQTGEFGADMEVTATNLGPKNYFYEI